MDPLTLRLARGSLVVVWLATALVSLIGGEGVALLASAGVPALWHAPLIISGAALDALLGLAMWHWHRPAVYAVSAAAMAVMTVAATMLLPGLWLDPLGRLLKNLPIAALLFILYRHARSE